MASMILGTIGTAIGGPIGGFIGSAIGSYIDSYLFAPSPPDVVGPKLTDLTTTRSSPGDPIPLLWGGDRISGNLIGAPDITEVKKTEKQGGKGGGQKSQKVTTYTYYLDCDWLLCEGPVLGIGRIWADGQVIRGFREELAISTISNPTKIGGIPYPDRFNTHLYNPNLVPHSLDRTYVPTLSTGLFIYNPVGDNFIPISGFDAGEIYSKNGKLVIYRQDSATGYFVPTIESHGFTGVKLEDQPQDTSPFSSFVLTRLLRTDPLFGDFFDSYTEEEELKPFRTFEDYYNLYDMLNDWSPQSIYGFSGAEAVNFYNGSMSQRSDPIMAAALGEDVPAYRGRAHIVFKQLELEPFGRRIPNLTFEVIKSDGDTVSSMIVDLMERANLDQTFYDLGALPTSREESFLMGYSVGRSTSFRAAIEPLLELYRIDAAEIGDSLVFRPKDRSYEHVITYSDLAAAEAGSTGGAPLRITYRDPLELPKTVTVTFKDAERDYQQNSALFSREQVNSTQESTLQFSAVVAPDRAKIFAREKTRDVWLERKSTPISLPHRYIYVSPSDVILVDGTDSQQDSLVLKVVEVTRGANGVLDMGCVVTSVNAYVPEAGETQRLGIPDVPFNGGISGDFVLKSTAVLLDLPPLREQDTQFGFYSVMGSTPSGTSSVWPGAFLYRETIDGSENIVIDDQEVEGVIGVVSASPLSAFDGYGIDRVSSVEVTLNRSTMSIDSETSDGILLGRNFAIMGNEVVQFLNATPLGGNTYRLDTFIRGHLDTVGPSVQSNHIVNERFAVLDSTTVIQTDDSVTNLNVERQFRAVTFENFIASATPQLFTNTGNRWKPFRPVMLDYFRDGSNNVTLSWQRQDRLQYAWIDLVDIPMSESFERYEVDVWSTDLSEVVRRITVDGSRTITYTAAQQTSDGITPGDPIQFTVYQISDQIGRGNPATETV